MILENWKIYEFSELVSLGKEKHNPKTSTENHECIELEHITQETGRLIKTTSVNKLFSTKNKYKKGDILFGKLRPYLRKYLLCEFNGVCSTEIWVFKPKDIAISEYLFYTVQRNSFIKYATISSGSKMPRADWNIVSTCPVKLPAKYEQKKIVNILQLWDKAIFTISDLIIKNSILKKGLMQQLLSGKQRFPEFNKPWGTVYLGEVFRNRTETNHNALPLLAITNKDGVVNRNTINKKDSSNKDKSRYLRICPGDIGYNTMRMWQGVSGLSSLEGIVSPAYTIVTPDNNIDAGFMAVFFKYPPTVNLFRRYSQGLVDDTLNLKFHHFSEIQVTIPEKEEQIKIASVFKIIDEKLELLQKKLETLKEQKKGLMQQLLTGKRRVKVKDVA